MLTKKELLKHPNYLLTKYQSEIFRQLMDYMNSHNLTQKEIAEKLNVSNAYISQILNGEFNFTLKKLIEIALLIGKVPALEFVDANEFWRRQKEGTIRTITVSKLVPILLKDKSLTKSTQPSVHFNINEPQELYA